MTASVRAPLKQSEQKIVYDLTSVSGTNASYFHVVSGSRMLVTLIVTAIDPGAQLDIFAEDSISGDDDFQTMSPGFSTNVVGVVKRVYSDFNSQVRIRYNITGGNVTFKIGVVLYDNASTTRIENAQLSVSIDAATDSLGHYDSVRVGDGTDLLAINPNGSINVVDDISADETPVNTYGEAPAVAAGAETIVLSYTVPADKIAFLYRIESAGENIARYKILVNGAAIATRRTYFGGDLTTTFDFFTPNKQSLVLQPGDLIQVSVMHNRPFIGDFEARAQLLLRPSP